MKNLVTCLFVLGMGITTYAQCFTNTKGERTLPVTATFSTAGEGLYKDKILWLTWGTSLKNYSQNPFGTKDIRLNVGDTSNAEIILGNNRYLCVQAKITSISGGSIQSDIPNDYSILDEMYNVKVNGNNILTNAISNRVKGEKVTINFSVESYLLDNKKIEPIKIPGLVLADAEQINASEFITMTADGEWNLIELLNKESEGVNYHYNKSYNSKNKLSTVRFDSGSDKKIAGVSMLMFNETAYGRKQDNYKTTFYSTLYGTGLSALAVGIIPPSVDMGDAPEKYGSPIHLFDGIKVLADSKTIKNESKDTDQSKFNNTNSSLSGSTNIGGLNNKISGKIIKAASNYLGKVGPDADHGTQFSHLADGDDVVGTPNDEDAWPDKWKRFSYKTIKGSNYLPEMKIDATIEYNVTVPSVIVGWVDFNLNGVFEDSERVIREVPTGSSSAQMVWTIPQTRKPYSTYVRLRIGKKADLEILKDPSSVVYGGEVEDHRINIMLNSVSNPALLNHGYIK